MARLLVAVLIVGLAAGCSTQLAPSPCPVTTDGAVLRVVPGVAASLLVPERWWGVAGDGPQSNSFGLSDQASNPTISIALGRYDAPFDDDMARTLIETAGWEIGATEVTLGDGVAREARVVDAEGPGAPRRVIEVFIPGNNGGTRVVSASTPVGLAHACRPQLDSVLGSITFD